MRSGHAGRPARTCACGSLRSRFVYTPPPKLMLTNHEQREVQAARRWESHAALELRVTLYYIACHLYDPICPSGAGALVYFGAGRGTHYMYSR